jgi:hypothetical protein
MCFKYNKFLPGNQSRRAVCVATSSALVGVFRQCTVRLFDLIPHVSIEIRSSSRSRLKFVVVLFLLCKLYVIDTNQNLIQNKPYRHFDNNFLLLLLLLLYPILQSQTSTLTGNRISLFSFDLIPQTRNQQS